MEEPDDHFRYIHSSSLKEPVRIKIGTLEGEKPPLGYEKLLNQPYLRFSGLYSEDYPPLQVRMQVFDKGRPYCLPVETSYKAFTKRWNWNEWLTLPLEYSDLTRTAMLALTIYDCARPGETAVVGGTTISLFGKNGVFRQGLYDLRLWEGVEGDGNCPTSTPGKGKQSSKLQMQRLSKMTKKYRNGQMQKVDWLDRVAFREIEQINAREKSKSEYMFLMVEFPQVVVDDKKIYSIVYFEPEGESCYRYHHNPKLVTVPDEEIDLPNLVECKHHRLARSERSHLSDRDAKPSAEIRDELKKIINCQPPTQALSNDEKDILWKYRFYLSTDKKALIKFLKCIDWQRDVESSQALYMLRRWEPMDVEDALELLTPAFKHPEVRKYAVLRLAEAPDEDLLLYLLQLVQALKYEDFNEIADMYKKIFHDRELLRSIDDHISALNQASLSMDQSNLHSVRSSPTYRRALSMIMGDVAIGSSTYGLSNLIKDACDSMLNEENSQPFSTNIPEGSQMTEPIVDSNTCRSPQLNLFAFLIRRACSNPTLANYLYWYLTVEIEDQENTPDKERVYNMYNMVREMFIKALESGNIHSQNTLNDIRNQRIFMEELVKLLKQVAKEPGNRTKKVEKFQQLLADPEAFKINFMKFEPTPLPLDPDVVIRGVVPEKATLFKSAMMPARINFLTTFGKREYVAIFKNGDDLRQDQLILQMIELLDKLLRRENLDLKLTPYKVLATSTKHGFLQFIDSFTIQEILGKDGNIQNFFRKHNPCETGPYGIHNQIMDTYIKSCAGYCVITYLLGIGDRHLDNLLITRNGNLFHIDFGYILGRDPKPMPAAMKLSREMVEGMGGITSEHHQEFRKYCYSAYLHLRRHANVMLNLFSLMVDASVPDIALEPDKAVKKVEDKLQLSKGDEEAVQHLRNVLDDSISAVMPVLVDKFHQITQRLRN